MPHIRARHDQNSDSYHKFSHMSLMISSIICTPTDQFILVARINVRKVSSSRDELGHVLDLKLRWEKEKCTSGIVKRERMEMQHATGHQRPTSSIDHDPIYKYTHTKCWTEDHLFSSWSVNMQQDTGINSIAITCSKFLDTHCLPMKGELNVEKDQKTRKEI